MRRKRRPHEHDRDDQDGRVQRRAEELSRRPGLGPASQARGARAEAAWRRRRRRGEPVGPDAAHLKAQAKTEAAGKKLCDPEKWKREEHPFDAYARLNDQAAKAEFPKPPDNFRWRYYGLFYVAPNQNSLYVPLAHPQRHFERGAVRGRGPGRARLSAAAMRMSPRAPTCRSARSAPTNAVKVVEAIQDLGLTSRGSGADNIRNVTGTSTAGIDPQELLDTRPYARSWHFHVLNDRSLTGLPRKFNVAFDGAGKVAVLEETNDIGFQAVEVTEGASVPAGIYFRLVLGGITGHQDIARDTGIVLPPDEATRVADAIVRVFVDSGDRTNRNKARLKYVLDDWGFDKFLAAVEDKLGGKLARVEPAHVEPRPQADRMAHLGVHPQKQDGLNWIGLVLPVGKLTAAQMRGIAAIARDLGDGDIRLTVWQNLLDLRRRRRRRGRGA